MSKTLIDVGYDVFIAVVTGGYSGWVVSRYFAFKQEIQRATESTFTLIDRHTQMAAITDETKASDKVMWLLLSPSIALNSEGHWKTSVDMKKLSIRLQDEMVSLWKEHRAIHADKLSTKQIEELVSSQSSNAANLMFAGLSEIAGYRPDYLSLLVGPQIAFKMIRQFRLKRRAYMELAEHMETGRPIKEIRAKNDQRK